MATFLRPAGSLLTGLFLLVLGSILGFLRYPSMTAWQAIGQVSTELVNLSLFSLSLICAFTGLIMLGLDYRGLQRRFHEINQAYHDHLPYPPHSNSNFID